MQCCTQECICLIYGALLLNNFYIIRRAFELGKKYWGVIIITLLTLFIIMAYVFRWQWTGFFSYTSTTITAEIPGSHPSTTKITNFHMEKTFWDWMELAIIPIVIAGGLWWLNKQERESEQKIAADRLKEQALQAYFDRMVQLLKELLKSKEEAGVRVLARAQTLTALHELDENRKGTLLRFLNEATLIKRYESYEEYEEALQMVPPSSFEEFLIKNLAIINLSQADLSFAHLVGASLVLANLGNANFYKANLIETNLTLVNLYKSNLQEANLSNSTLLVAHLYKANLYRANLTKAKLLAANLYEANLQEANLSEADLSEADLQKVNLHRANLYKADLTGANLEGANLSKANLYGADLSEASVYKARLKMEGLEKDNLPDNVAKNAAGRNDDKIKIVNLRKANLTEANLRGANLDKADLQETNLSKAEYDSTTKWPDNFDPVKAGAILKRSYRFVVN